MGVEQAVRTIFSYTQDFSTIILIFELMMIISEKKKKAFIPKILIGGFLYLLVPHLTSDYYMLSVKGFNYGFIIVFLLSVLLLWSCFETDIWQVFFIASAAFNAQNLCFAIKSIFRVSMNFTFETFSYQVLSQVIDLTAYLLLYLLVVRKWSLKDFRSNSKQTVVLSIVTVFTVNIITQMMYRVNGENMRVLDYVCSILFCSLLLYIQFGMIKEYRQQQVNEQIELLLHMQAKQQEISNENVKLINIKCHDLKKQINILKAVDEKEKTQYIEELQNAVDIYDSRIKTGNEILDIILTERNLRAKAKQITLFCIMENGGGSGFSFMKSADLSALFGNAIENAMEAVEKLPEGERNVEIVIQSNPFCKISVENPYVGTLTFENGMPLTQKSNRFYHGFGIKSMKYIVDKYHGNMTVQNSNNHFRLSIMFPEENAGK